MIYSITAINGWGSGIIIFLTVFPEMMEHLICDLTADTHSLGCSAL